MSFVIFHRAPLSLDRKPQGRKLLGRGCFRVQLQVTARGPRTQPSSLSGRLAIGHADADYLFTTQPATYGDFRFLLKPGGFLYNAIRILLSEHFNLPCNRASRIATYRPKYSSLRGECKVIPTWWSSSWSLFIIQYEKYTAERQKGQQKSSNLLMITSDVSRFS